MRKYIVGIVALFVLLTVTLSASAAPEEHKVTGGGWFYFPTEEVKTTVSFTAQIDADGNVKGQIQVQDRPDYTWHAEVTDLVMVGDNAAEIYGIVTKADDPSLIGLPVFLDVVDNGEGKGAVDTIRGLPFNGNIQVR